MYKTYIFVERISEVNLEVVAEEEHRNITSAFESAKEMKIEYELSEPLEVYVKVDDN